MFPRLAHALEILLGPSLATASATLARAATVALAAVVTIALARAALSIAARRYGWERAWIVRCPGCGGLVADPRQATCAAGHKLRFPPGASRAADWRGKRGRALAFYSILLSLAVAAAAFGAHSWLRIGAPGSPLSRLCGAAAYFFFLAALYAGDFALSPRPRGAGARLLHVGLALACLTPFLFLALLSRAFEPGERRVEGTLWATPSGVYISDGRARRLGPPAAAIQARLVEARLPAIDLEWRGLAGFRVGAEEVPWRGRGGFLARWLERSAESIRGRGILVRRFTEEVPLPPNIPVGIVRLPEGFEFEPQTTR
jgi:hypothetical protein